MVLTPFLILSETGEVYAIVTPNEEAANGLAGLTTILSVLFMGFLITLNAMPDGWKWANHADLLRYVIQGMCSNELGDNRYLLFDPNTVEGGSANATIFGELGGNATNMFLTPRGTDRSPGSRAGQASTIMNLVLAASPSLNQNWNSSILGTTANMIDCGMDNNCFVEPVARNFMSCFVFGILQSPPCGDEFDAAAAAFEDGSDNVAKCLGSGAGENAISNIIIDAAASILSPTLVGNGGNDTSAIANFGLLTEEQQAEMVLCLLNATLPGGTLQEIKEVISNAIYMVSGISIVAESIIDVITNGLPGEVILFVFGWAKFEDGELIAPYKWWYCMFAVCMFVVGLEFFKILGTGFIIWTKR